MLKLRLQRFGKKKKPIYRIVAIEKSKKRNGEPSEVLGFYDPINKFLVYNTERASYWKSVGAQVSDTVSFLLNKEPAHDLAKGPYQFVAQPRNVKEARKAELLKASTKNTKAKKKHAEAAAAASAAAAKAKEEPAAEAPAAE